MQKSFLTRKLSRALNKAQITYALSLFISSGYDLQEAMKFVPKLVDDKQLRANLEKCNEDLINGDSFVEVIKKISNLSRDAVKYDSRSVLKLDRLI